MATIVPFCTRPWGTFEVLSSLKESTESGDIDVVIKKITVLPGKRLSLQSHTGRDERWFLITGQGEIIIGEKKNTATAGDTVFIPKETKHRIANTGTSIPLVFIEIATGTFDENDIVRYEDDFGRA